MNEEHMKQQEQAAERGVYAARLAGVDGTYFFTAVNQYSATKIASQNPALAQPARPRKATMKELSIIAVRALDGLY